jgi:hypothetical protein
MPLGAVHPNRRGSIKKIRLTRFVVAARWCPGQTVNRYNLALLLLTLGVMPLFYVNSWLGIVAVIAIYGLVARLANKDFDRKRLHSSGLRAEISRRRPARPPVIQSARDSPIPLVQSRPQSGSAWEKKAWTTCAATAAADDKSANSMRIRKTSEHSASQTLK